MAKIMIVDDEPDLVATLKVLVSKAGHDVDYGCDGREFLDKVEKVRPDLVLLDIMMPGLSTKEILGRLREKRVRRPKVILLTAVRLDAAEREELLKDPLIVDYITKPFDIDNLMESIETHLQ